MEVIARVEGTHGVHFVRVGSERFECNVRPRPPLGALITITFAISSLEEWRRIHAPTGELDRRFYRPTTLADLMSAANANAFMSFAREASADELTAFSRDRGGALLAEIRGALDRGTPVDPIVARTARFMAVLGIRETSLAELEGLHPVEHLMALEHAVVSWIRTTSEPPPDKLAALSRSIPSDTASAGLSLAWFQWWWQLARHCTRSDLAAIVSASLAIVKTECRYGTAKEVARVAIDEAIRLGELARTSPRAILWAAPPHAIVLAEVMRDEDDAHYAAYMALTHCAHALAATLRANMDPPDANRHAGEILAHRALGVLR